MARTQLQKYLGELAKSEVYKGKKPTGKQISAGDVYEVAGIIADKMLQDPKFHAQMILWGAKRNKPRISKPKSTGKFIAYKGGR